VVKGIRDSGMEDMEANSIYLIPNTICFIHVSWSTWPGMVIQLRTFRTPKTGKG
jgi:hypothetical protein